jgi:dienelactone hydrolase
MDFVFANKSNGPSFVETSKLGLVGMSLGGYLTARAAAFEPRLAADMCIDGVYSLLDASFKIFPETRVRGKMDARKNLIV